MARGYRRPRRRRVDLVPVYAGDDGAGRRGRTRGRTRSAIRSNRRRYLHNREAADTARAKGKDADTTIARINDMVQPNEAQRSSLTGCARP